MKNKVLALVAVSEGAAGVVLLVSPAIVVHLLFGAEIAGAGADMTRLAASL
jgi:hypothetical protein